MIRRRLVGLALVAAGVLGAALVLVGLALLVYPGMLELAASGLCPDDQPDAYAVRFTTRTDEGSTMTDVSLFCMGEHGQFSEVGLLAPYLRLTVILAAVLFVPFLALTVGAARRLRRSRGAAQVAAGAAPTDGPPATAGAH